MTERLCIQYPDSVKIEYLIPLGNTGIEPTPCVHSMVDRVCIHCLNTNPATHMQGTPLGDTVIEPIPCVHSMVERVCIR